MIKAVLVDDDPKNITILKTLLEELKSGIEVAGEANNVEEAVRLIPLLSPNLVFLDIEMPFGNAFDLLDKLMPVKFEVIFITAFDEYWQKAFEYNGIDYLLKPLKQERLKTALTKFHELKDYFTARYQNLLDYQKGDKKFKERFLVKRGKEYASIKVEDIAFFYATHKLVCLVEKEGSKFIMDNSLSEIEKQVDSFYFFRANRKYLVHKKSIKKIVSLPKSRLLLELAPVSPGELIVSSDNSSDFKTWMNG